MKKGIQSLDSFSFLFLILLTHHSPLLAQDPPVHVVRNFEAVRIDGDQAWLSFYDNAAYEGFLWNNKGTMTLGTSHLNTAGQIKFVTNNAERMIIHEGGNVSIGGLPTSYGRLQVYDNSEAIYAGSNTSYGVYGFSNSATGVSGNSLSWYGVTGSGTFGVLGSGGEIGVRAEGGSYDFYAQGAGIDYGSSSSRRWKTNIRNIDDPLRKIAALHGVYYTWDKDHGGHPDVGFIAEEVGKVLPEIVAYEENGIDAKGLDYSKMTPLLVEAFNAMQREHETLKAEHQKTLDRISHLEKMILATSSSH